MRSTALRKYSKDEVVGKKFILFPLSFAKIEGNLRKGYPGARPLATSNTPRGEKRGRGMLILFEIFSSRYTYSRNHSVQRICAQFLWLSSLFFTFPRTLFQFIIEIKSKILRWYHNYFLWNRWKLCTHSSYIYNKNIIY